MAGSYGGLTGQSVPEVPVSEGSLFCFFRGPLSPANVI
jgi:hypothetical protein